MLVPWLFKWPDPGLTFDIALHIGTLVAVVVYFWKDWIHLTVKGITDRSSRDGKLFWYLVLASVPGAAIGFLLEDKAESVFRTPLLIAAMLIAMGMLLSWADRTSVKNTDVEGISLSSSFLIGLSQALAIIPGVSRSGITMSAGLMLGLTRKARRDSPFSSPPRSSSGSPRETARGFASGDDLREFHHRDARIVHHRDAEHRVSASIRAVEELSSLRMVQVRRGGIIIVVAVL